jgi:hypothetical protein
MSLRWQVTDCDNHEELLSEKHWPVTSSILMASMWTGINRITEETAEDFTTRLTAWTKVYGPAANVVGEGGEITPYRITLADVRRRTGAWTNATPMTAQRFRATLIKGLMREAADLTAADRKKMEHDEP